MTNNKQSWIVLGIAGVVLVIAGFMFGHSKEAKSFGAVGTNAIENYVPAILYNGGYYSNLPIQTTATITGGGSQTGTTGTIFSFIAGGTTSLIYSDSVVTASTTKAFDIAVSGVVSTDNVFVQTATTTANGTGWLITGASASSTSGFITLRVANNSGATGNVPRNIASSTAYWVFR